MLLDRGLVGRGVAEEGRVEPVAAVGEVLGEVGGWAGGRRPWACAVAGGTHTPPIFLTSRACRTPFSSRPVLSVCRSPQGSHHLAQVVQGAQE